MKKIIFVGIVALMVLGTSSCKKIDEIKNDIVSTEDNATMESEFMSLFEIAEDVNANEDKLRRAAGTHSLPSGVIVDITDSLLNDGDGYEYNIDFGSLGTTSPKGILCNDGKYRAGKVYVKMDKKYAAPGLIVNVDIAESDSFYSGNGTFMTKFSGNIILNFISQHELKLDILNGKGSNDNGNISFQSHKLIKRTAGMATSALSDDEFEVTGSGSGVNRNGENYTINIDKKLKKVIKPGCASTFVSGIITLKNTSSSSEMIMDFDAYNNEACDKLVKVIINKKEFFFTVK